MTLKLAPHSDAIAGFEFQRLLDLINTAKALHDVYEGDPKELAELLAGVDGKARAKLLAEFGRARETLARLDHILRVAETRLMQAGAGQP